MISRDEVRINEFCKRFCAVHPLAADRFSVDEPMDIHSTFKVGGKADYFFSAASGDELAGAVRSAREAGLPVTVLGNCSNILVSDKGIRGLVVVVSKHMSGMTLENDHTIDAQAGVLLSAVSKFAASNSLTGLEFASGIPGTLGGAVYMNAGAYGGCMADIVVSSRGLDTQTLEIFELEDARSHIFGYRKSFYSSNNAVVISARLKLAAGDQDSIAAAMNDFACRRRGSQPLDLPSAGSTFKRPDGHYAGRLIEEAGLKGFRIGGACVSTKHAGFIVNDRGAVSSDILKLIEHVQDTVYNSSGIRLEPEVRILGEW